MVLWGGIAALAVVALDFFLSGHFNYGMLLIGALVGTLFSSLGFALLWSARSGRAIRYLKPLLVVFVIGQVVLLVWTILDR